MEKEQKFSNVIKINGLIDDKLYEVFDESCQIIMDTYNLYVKECSLVKDEYINPFPEILIEINSPGGYTSIGCAILDKMQEMKDLGLKLHTHAVGSCMSMAFIIFLFADKRSGGKYCRWMNHGSSGYHGGYLEEAKSSLENELEVEALFEEIIFKQTNMPKERVEMARNRTDYFGLEEAKKLNVVNYYEGCEIQKEEDADRVGKAIETSVNVFSQMLEIDETTSIDLMAEILNTALKTIEKEDDSSTQAEQEHQDKQCEAEECFKQLNKATLACKGQNDCDKCESQEECEDDLKYANDLLNRKKSNNDKHTKDCNCECKNCCNNDNISKEEDKEEARTDNMLKDKIDEEKVIKEGVSEEEFETKYTKEITECKCESKFGEFKNDEACKECSNIKQCVDVTLKEIESCKYNYDTCSGCPIYEMCAKEEKDCFEYLKQQKNKEE